MTFFVLQAHTDIYIYIIYYKTRMWYIYKTCYVKGLTVTYAYDIFIPFSSHNVHSVSHSLFTVILRHVIILIV